MDPRVPWLRVKTAVMVFAAATALLLVGLAYAALRGAVELPHSHAAGAITPALQRFASAASILAYTAQALLCGAILVVTFWLARHVTRRPPPLP